MNKSLSHNVDRTADQQTLIQIIVTLIHKSLSDNIVWLLLYKQADRKTP